MSNTPTPQEDFQSSDVESQKLPVRTKRDRIQSQQEKNKASNKDESAAPPNDP